MKGVLLKLWAVAALLFCAGLVAYEVALYTWFSEEDVAYWHAYEAAPWLRAAERLEAAPDADAALAVVQADYGVPMRLLGADEVDPEAHEQLAEGLKAAWLYRDGNERTVVPVGDDRFLVVGPFVWKGTWVPQRALVVALVASLLLLGFGFVLRPVYQAQKRVVGAARSLAEGRLDTRITVDDLRAAPEMVEAFNHMAARTQELVEAQRALLRTVSHELRTPAARLQLAVHARRSELGEAAEPMLADLAELEGLVEELLVLARLEGGGEERVRQKVRLAPLVVDVVEDLEPLAGEVDLELVSSSVAVVRVVPELFVRALTNPLRNALRYASRRVEVSVLAEAGRVRVQIDDDGPGIRAADRERALQPFVKLDERGQHGLGLAIADQVMRWHEGRVSLAVSELGGLRVTLELDGEAA